MPTVNYSLISMTRTSLGPQKFVRAMGSSSHWWLIVAPGQEANGDNFRMYFWSSTKLWYVECTLESPRRGDSNEYTQHILFVMKQEMLPKIAINICFELSEEFPKDSKKSSNKTWKTSHRSSSHWGFTVYEPPEKAMADREGASWS